MLLPLLEDAGNRLLRLDVETLRRLGDLDGRVLCLRFVDIDRRLYLFPSEGGMRLAAECAGKPDATLSGPLRGFVRLGLRGGDSDAFRDSGIEFSGDIELAQRLQRVIQGLDIDWEEQLAAVLGDVPAHGLGRVLRGAWAWQREARSLLARDLAEYLQHERGELPTRRRAEAWMRAVDTLRDDVERLERRVARLRARSG